MEDTKEHMLVRDELDSLLRDMYDFGDDFATQRKMKKKTISESQSKGLPKTEDMRKINESEECTVQSNPCSKSKTKKTLMFFKTLRDEMHVQDNLAQTTFVEDHGGSVSVQGEPSVEVVTFSTSRGKRKRKSTNNAECEAVIETKSSTNDAGDTREMFNFEKARLEVHKFGITGFRKEKQRVFEKERAIMLGAKPPKKEYLNYKVYQDMVKEEKATKLENKRTENRLESTNKRQKQGSVKRNSKKSRTSVGIIPTGHVGKFKNGALFLSGKDISKIKHSKVK